MLPTTIVNAGTTARYRALLVDETGAAVAGSALSTLTLTLIDATSKQKINSRDAQNVLNLNGVTVFDAPQGAVDENGNHYTFNLEWILAPADTTVIDGTHKSELRRAVFIATWGGTKQMEHEYDFTVRTIPQP